ncbi:MAG: rhodanese-like domain-containing protein [Saprospiraceae bacterium]|nr:rhodanese-like domain-containing protein [Saprospiraceae bacterium]
MNVAELFQQEGLTLIDVREPFEFSMGHAEGAINIPLGSIPANIDRIRQMQQPVILYCRSGNRSGQAEAFLRNCGVPQAYNVGSLEDVLHYQQVTKV